MGEVIFRPPPSLSSSTAVLVVGKAMFYSITVRATGVMVSPQAHARPATWRPPGWQNSSSDGRQSRSLPASQSATNDPEPSGNYEYSILLDHQLMY